MIKIGHCLGLLGISAIIMVVVAGVNSAVASDCIGCHANVLKQLRGNSHHIQGTRISGKHCYACHWEATATGLINPQYHQGNIRKKSSKVKKGKVDLVIWAKGERPTAYIPEDTAVTFISSAIGTPAERDEVAKITRHCLGCHSDSNNNTRPFLGDTNIPLKYAWDGQSIASRYSQKDVTTWGKYSTAATNKKQRVIKAFSAHGNAAANQGGWSASNGYDGDIPVTRGGVLAKNVECFDCHNSHGSTISGVTSSYRTFDGTFNGAIIKETSSGKSGYQINYKPSANTYAKSKNPFNSGAGLCFDCHETAKPGATPWGFNFTFGVRQAVMGYKDTLGFGPGSKGSTERFSNRQSREDVASSHLKAGKYLEHAEKNQINGLCTPCHDPHGVSRTLGDKMPYAVPLLKGAWLTSPYREDGPPSSMPVKGDRGPTRQADFNTINRQAGANFGKGSSGAPREADFNAVNKAAGANYGKGASSAPHEENFNAVNREAGANFGKGASGVPREGDFNAVNREAGANYGKGASSVPREENFNAVNREAGANFGKGASGAPHEGDFNAVNRTAGANFGKGASEVPREGDFNTVASSNRDTSSNFVKGGNGAPREPMQGMKYNVDRNTFSGDNRITENDDTFGGLCLNCHSKAKLSDKSKAGLVHRAVKGWGSNKEHSFPCSKCHQSHSSGLPRLMQTNCFEQGPATLRKNSGLPWLPYKEVKSQEQGGPNSAVQGGVSSKNKIVGCHVKQFSKSNVSSNKEEEGNHYKEVTTW
ncbi:MAG TPA: hypothetical protein VGJ93_11270 [Desulfuromonadaceae bacterium]|jgi:hypothetical protein